MIVDKHYDVDQKLLRIVFVSLSFLLLFLFASFYRSIKWMIVKVNKISWNWDDEYHVLTNIGRNATQSYNLERERILWWCILFRGTSITNIVKNPKSKRISSVRLILSFTRVLFPSNIRFWFVCLSQVSRLIRFAPRSVGECISPDVVFHASSANTSSTAIETSGSSPWQKQNMKRLNRPYHEGFHGHIRICTYIH